MPGLLGVKDRQSAIFAVVATLAVAPTVIAVAGFARVPATVTVGAGITWGYSMLVILVPPSVRASTLALPALPAADVISG